MDMFEFSISEFAQTLGYVGIGLVVFLESGVPIGFFLPGDTLLFAAGVLSSAGFFNIYTLVVIVVIAAILGDNVGYAIGKRFGPALFAKEEALFFSKKNMERTQKFYEKFGRSAIVFARFFPVIRTFAPIMAGVGGMKYQTFLSFNIIGALLWGAGVTLLGYSLGSVIPNVEHYLLPLMLLIALTSFIPALKHLASRRAK